MARRILVLHSSPHKNGNTRTVVNWFAEGARQANAQVEIIDVAHLHYKVNGCIACMGCQQSSEYGCVIADEAQPILARIPEYDGLVFASPIYLFDVNAQLKLILDRMFSLIKFDPETGTVHSPAKGRGKLGFIATAGGPPEGGLSHAEEVFRTMAQFLDQPYSSLLVPNAPREPGAIQQNAALQERVFAYGREFAG